MLHGFQILMFMCSSLGFGIVFFRFRLKFASASHSSIHLFLLEASQKVGMLFNSSLISSAVREPPGALSSSSTLNTNTFCPYQTALLFDL